LNSSYKLRYMDGEENIENPSPGGEMDHEEQHDV